MIIQRQEEYQEEYLRLCDLLLLSVLRADVDDGTVLAAVKDWKAARRANEKQAEGIAS